MQFMIVSLVFAVQFSSDTPDEAQPARQLSGILADEAAFDPELTDRAARLADLRTEDSDNAVWWHSGYLKVDGEWMHYDEATSETAAAIGNEQQYKKLRSLATSAKEHLKLAKWCKAREMPHRFRLHVFEALRLDPSIATVRTPGDLGLVEYNGAWLTPELARQAKNEEQFQKQSFEQWEDICLQIRTKLLGSPVEIRNAKRLAATINSPDAIPAVDFLIGQHSVAGARLAVSLFAGISGSRSSAVLAKYAVFASAESIRSSATEALATRRFSEFVPAVLDLMATEITETTQDVRPLRSFGLDPGIFLPELTFQRIWRTETRSLVATRRSTISVNPRIQLVTMRLQRPSVWPRNRVFNPRRLDRLNAKTSITTQQAWQAADRIAFDLNQQIRQTNKRVTYVLNEVTDQQDLAVQDWWTWWENRTGVDPVDKNVIEVEEVEEREIVGGSTTVVQIQSAGSCFAAGTSIRTADGLRPIEAIQPGDRVLSQEIETGKIEFRVVEQSTTRRRPGPTITIEAGAETLTCTPGHEIWQNGVGWVRAKELEPGDLIRTLTGSAIVQAIEEARQQITYNLVVEGNHNYFAGESGFLVQDITTAAPTDNVVPGLSRFDLED